MNDSVENDGTLIQYPVWDRLVRSFHWINVLCVIGLAAIGTAILYSKALGVSIDGKILLKTIHVYIGYLFVVNLSLRIIWGFFGGRYARWSRLLPFGKSYRKSLRVYVEEIKKGRSPKHLGHNPIGRLMVTLLFLFLSLQAVTGLVLAGTDLYFPPFGHEIAKWVSSTGDASDVADIKPYSKTNVDPDSYKEMREFRKPFITVHYFVFFGLMFAIVFHIIGVVVAELREKSGLVSAMFSGYKNFREKPVDID